MTNRHVLIIVAALVTAIAGAYLKVTSLDSIAVGAMTGAFAHAMNFRHQQPPTKDNTPNAQ